MIDQQELETIFSATYLEDFVDACEILPIQIFKELSNLKHVDSEFDGTLNFVEELIEDLVDRPSMSNHHHRVFMKDDLRKMEEAIMHSLNSCLGKREISDQIQTYLEGKNRVLDLDRKNMIVKQSCELTEQSIKSAFSNFQSKKLHVNTTVILLVCSASIRDCGPKRLAASSSSTSTPNARPKPLGRPPKRRRSTRKSAPACINADANDEGKEKCVTTNSSHERDKELSEVEGDATKIRKEIQTKKGNGQKKKSREVRSFGKSRGRPNSGKEPKYCFCKQESYGDMIGCDNEFCPVEWFHFSCLKLTSKPRGKWYCPLCRGDRPNVMKKPDVDPNKARKSQGM